MGDSKKVKRTDKSEDTGNTIKENTGVTIILDQPTESDDKFQLVGGSEDSKAKYDKTLGAGDAKALTDGYDVLRFDGVRLKGVYRLVHKRAKGDKRNVFLDTRFKDLTEAGHGPNTAEFHYATLPHKPEKKLPDRYGTDRGVDEDLVGKTFKLLELDVEDPEL